ncbi:hypothetical protein BDD14_0224 [Edaphobacter modestus]|uniref:Uncharacterized protein n=1 Tax=Edaphobacter modestus TaxID=388466 RepID=A0A4V2G3Z6_9BACT|nr:hypothetical protein BDD14_0224 [Edaphobacter modestus]
MGYPNPCNTLGMLSLLSGEALEGGKVEMIGVLVRNPDVIDCFPRHSCCRAYQGLPFVECFAKHPWIAHKSVVPLLSTLKLAWLTNRMFIAIPQCV